MYTEQPMITHGSEIMIDDICGEESIDNMMAQSYHDAMSSRNKVIPTNVLDSECRQTFYDVKNRNTWDDQNQGCLKRICKFFTRAQKNKITRKQMIELRQRDLLNDYAYITNENVGFMKTTATFFSKYLRVIDPDSLFYIFWQLLNCILVIFFFFEIPFVIMFQIEQIGIEIVQIIVVLSILLFVIDILISLNTAYYNQGQLEFNRKLIVKHYFSKYFLLDAIPILCLLEQSVLIDKRTNYSYSQILFCLKVYEIFRSTDRFQEYLQLNRKYLAIYRLLTLFLTIIWLCHIFACVFYAVGHRNLMRSTAGEGFQLTWLKQVDLITLKESYPHYGTTTLSEYYSYSFYWAVTTMISVGYGDITPKNIEEVWVTVFSMFVSCIVFAYSINAIWEVIRESNENKLKFQKYVTAIHRFMNDHHVNRRLKNKIEAYMAHLWETEKSRDQELEQAMIKKLAPGLKEELVYDTFGRLLQSSDFFRQNFSDEFLRDLSEQIEEVNFSQGETIFQQEDEWDDFAIYYLALGQVEVYLQSNTKKSIKLSALRVGTLFGTIGFITGIERTASAKCQTYCRVYKLTRDNFLKAIEGFPKDKQQFHEIRHNVMFNNKYGNAKLKCYICESQRHLAYRCDKTHYIPNKKAVIEENYNQACERVKTHQRIVKKPFRALLHFNELQAHANVIRRYHQNITFHQDSSEEDDEYSSDVDDYEEELEDIKKIVAQEKEMAQLKKDNRWLVEEEEQNQDVRLVDRKTALFGGENYDLKVSQDGYQDGMMQQQDLFISQNIDRSEKSRANDSDNNSNTKKSNKKIGKQPRKDFRTASMVSMQPITEKVQRKKSSKQMTPLPRKEFLEKKSIEEMPARARRKMTTEIPGEKTEKSSPLLIQDENIRNQLIKKLKTIQVLHQRDPLLKDLADQLRAYMLPSKTDIKIEQKVEEQEYAENRCSDVDSEFSIDQYCNYQHFFVDSNPSKIIGNFRKRNGRNKYRQKTYVHK